MKHRKIIKSKKYREIELLDNYIRNGYFRDRLDQILEIFEYADSFVNIKTKFVRFDFGEEWTKEQVLLFFKSITKWHRRHGFFFLYCCAMEENKWAKMHFHAFCIVNSENYPVRKHVINMLKDRSLFIMNKNQHLKLKPPHVTIKPPKNMPYPDKIKTYNFYSISPHIENNFERKAALTAASYLAKTTQTPIYAANENDRTFYRSNIFNS